MRYIFITLFSFCFFLIGLGSEESKVSISGVVWNESLSQTATSIEVELIALGEKFSASQMNILQKVKVYRGAFRFLPINPPQVPLLLRCYYQETSYILLIPPQKKFWAKTQKLKIYESGAKIEDINLSSAISVYKKKKGLLVEKLYTLENTSAYPKSFSLKNIHFYIPEKAHSILASLRYTKSRVAIPLALEKQDGYYFISKGVRPEPLEMTIRYFIPSYILEDKMWVFPNSKTLKKEIERVLIWKPKDAKPTIQNAKLTEVEIPNVGTAYKVLYAGDAKLSYNFSKGSILYDDPMQSDFNPIFDTPIKTILGLLAMLVYLFSLLFFFSKKRTK